MSFISEILQYLKIRKKFWMIPILFFMLLLGGIVIMTQGSAVAPFIYSLF